jgi:hypothetical protein
MMGVIRIHRAIAGPHAEFRSIEEINNYLLQHKEVLDPIEKRDGSEAVF